MTIPDSPAESGVSDLRVLAKSRNKWFWAFWISGILMILPLLIGIAGTVTGMIGAFDELGRTGHADPEALAGQISVALVTTMLGLAVSFLAFVVFVVSLVVFLKKNRALRALQTANPPNKSE